MASNEQNTAPMIAIGEKLRQAREKRSLDMGQVQKQTHIHSTVLMALEDGRCDEILTPTYVRGFLKKYAQYLGLDTNQLLKEYDSLHHGSEDQGIVLGRPERRGGVDWPAVIRYARIVIIFALVFFIAAFLWRKVISPKKISVSKPAARAVKSKSPGAVASGKTGVQRKQVQKTSPVKKEAATAKNKPFKLTMKVNEPVWVEVTQDGVLLFKRFLPKGTTDSFSAQESIVLYVAKAEAIELVLDGKSIGSPGNGLIKRLEITKSGTRIK